MIILTDRWRAGGLQGGRRELSSGPQGGLLDGHNGKGRIGADGGWVKD
jgi:hypothetical protein